MGKRPAPQHRAWGRKPVHSQFHAPPTPLPFSGLSESAVPGLPPGRAPPVSTEEKHADSGRSQEPSFRKRGTWQDSGATPVLSPALQGLLLSQLLPPSTSGWEAGQGSRPFPSLSCRFWLRVRACLLENKTKEVTS